MEDATPPLISEQPAAADVMPQQDQPGELAVLNFMADAVCCVDTEGRFTFVNAAFETLTGYASADLLGTPSTHIYGPEAEALFLKRRRQVQNNSAVPPYLETELLLKNGERLPVELLVSSLVIEGRITGCMAVVRRITAQKQTEAALQMANNELEQCVAERTAQLQEALEALLDEMHERQQVQEALFQREKLAALGELLANVAHELNNPLAVAFMQVQNLQEEWGTGAWTEDFDLLRQAIERCQSVIQSFLALVRQQTPTRHAIDLNAVIDEALVLLGHSLEVDGITVSLHLDAHLPPVWADAHQLHHVIANLITNAHHALQQTSSSPHLALTTAAYTCKLGIFAYPSSCHAGHERRHLKFLVISSSSFATPFEGNKPRFSSSHCLA
jgi:PAS domain S-box-containing protein